MSCTPRAIIDSKRPSWPYSSVSPGPRTVEGRILSSTNVAVCCQHDPQIPAVSNTATVVPLKRRFNDLDDEDFDDVDYEDNDNIQYDDSKMIYHPKTLQTKFPTMNINEVVLAETVIVTDKGRRVATKKCIEELFASNNIALSDHYLYHVTSLDNAQGEILDLSYENNLEQRRQVEQPPTENLNGINKDHFIHPVKVRGKGMQNVWCVQQGAIIWAINHHIQAQGMPANGMITLLIDSTIILHPS